LWDELSSVYLAAQILGYDKPDPNQIYNLSDAQLEAVKNKLIELKNRTIRKYLVEKNRRRRPTFQNMSDCGDGLAADELMSLARSISRSGKLFPRRYTTAG